MGSVGDEPYDVIIVGAGILGLFTAYNMQKKGLRVLLLDQFQLPHKRGSSGDPSRILRLFYGKQPYAAMALESYRKWQQLELATGEELFRLTGALVIYDGEQNRKTLENTTGLMEKNRLKYDILSSAQMNARFPNFRFEPDSVGLYDYSGGCLLGIKCSRVLLSEFLKHGGTLRDGEKVTRITPGRIVAVSTTRVRQYRARHLVLAPGPWARRLLLSLGLDLPLKSIPALPCYWKEKVEGSHGVGAGMPIFVHELQVPQGYQFIYGFPSLEYPGMVKVGTRGEPALDPRDPDERDRQDRAPIIAQLSAYIQSHLPGLEATAPAIVESCMYTCTPDGDFVIDRHPQHANVLIAAGGSGHAFKMAPVIGELLTELATGSVTSFDITPFKVTRFQPAAKI